MKPTNSMGGMTHHVRRAPPVRPQSSAFIASSIASMEMKDMPKAVRREKAKECSRSNNPVSKMMEVIRPFIIAKAIM